MYYYFKIIPIIVHASVHTCFYILYHIYTYTFISYIYNQVKNTRHCDKNDVKIIRYCYKYG